ncbi:MAG: hypothetical protein IBX55_10785 [Methyloprofundus sp.]|nr:hypothetical protein [Methyloprofundus sp.]
MTYISLELGKPPETVAEAVDRLLVVLSDDQKAEIAAMKEDDLIDLHFGLGREIRNAFGLHDLGSKLLADCGTPHPDDGAGVIVKKLWDQLKYGN